MYFHCDPFLLLYETLHKSACVSSAAAQVIFHLSVQIQQELERIGRFRVPSNVMVALFLVRQGADPQAGDERGISPFQIRSPDVATLLLTFMSNKG